MHALADLYKTSLALVTDLYELTMAYGYWKSGLDQREAVFHLAYRKNPFAGQFAVACGLETAAEYLESLRFDRDDLDYLATLEGADGLPLFEAHFLDVLGRLRWDCDVDAVPEGTVVFGHEPLVRVRGPLLSAQIVESALLNLVNFQTLVATKAARVVAAAGPDPVLEFGLRRAHGIDGALSASRAAYVGGCAATSNTLAGRLFGIPVRGTHAHSWVMCFDDEPAAFRAYADAMPGNTIFLVDTYDTLDGVRHAVEAGRRLRHEGHEMVGVRLDSGDLAELSIEARRMLDEAGFPDAAIVASNDLDEQAISELKAQGAPIGVWGVGTRLVTGHPDAALGGVYKLSAVRGDDGVWHDKVKLSDDEAKGSDPGILQVRRFFEDGRALADVIYDQRQPPQGDCVVPPSGFVVPPSGGTSFQNVFPPHLPFEDLLIPVFRDGRRVGERASLEDARRRRARQLAMFRDEVTRLDRPVPYPVGLEIWLYERKMEIIQQQRKAEA